MPDEQEYLGNIGSLSQSTLSRLVYIVGSARGGTTLFHRMVGIHKQILTFPGPSHFINQVWRYRKKVHNRLFMQIFRMPAFYQEETVVKSLGTEGLNELRRLINKRLASRNLRLMWQLYPIIYALNQRPTLVPSTIKCWVEKETNCSSLNAISTYFPKAKFLFIVRDPRSTVTSLAQRATAKLTASYPTHIDNTTLIDSCIHWRHTMQKILQFSKKNPESCLKVYFEELLMNPGATLNNVYEFIGADRLPESLILSRTSELPYKRSNDYSDQMEGQGLSKDAFDRWKNSLTNSELSIIENITGPTARKLGYAVGDRDNKFSLLGILMTIKNKKKRLLIGAKFIYISIYENLV